MWGKRARTPAPATLRGMRGEVWRWSARGAGLGAGLLAMAAVATVLLASTGVLVIVLVSLLLAAGLEPFVGWVRGRVRLPRGATVLLVYAVFLVLVVALVLIIVPAAIDQMSDFTARLPTLLDDLRTWAGTLGDGLLGSTALRLIETVDKGLGSPIGHTARPVHDRRGGADRRGRGHHRDHDPHARLLLAHRPPAHPAIHRSRCCRWSIAPASATAGTRSRRAWACGSAAS